MYKCWYHTNGTRKVYNILTTYSKPYKRSKHIVQHTTYKQVQVSTSTSNLSEDRIRIHFSTSQNIILWEILKSVTATIHRKTSWTRGEKMLTEVGLDQQSSDPPLFILIHILNIIILSDSTTTRHQKGVVRYNNRWYNTSIRDIIQLLDIIQVTYQRIGF